MSKELKDLLICEKFMSEIIKCETDNEIFEKFSKEGVELSSEELGAIKKLYREVAKDVKEMSPDEIEKVSGGGDDEKKLALDIVIGSISGAILGAASGISKVWNKKDKSGFRKAVEVAYSIAVGTGAGVAAGGGAGIFFDALK
ncbi:MAG: hypothetical protein LBK29_01760 [Oscillospiraceae bacterium]|nr:hypothetical protein [Oscillospiraceae bacterium]